jgi:hypothetical protein
MSNNYQDKINRFFEAYGKNDLDGIRKVMADELKFSGNKKR